MFGAVVAYSLVFVSTGLAPFTKYALSGRAGFASKATVWVRKLFRRDDAKRIRTMASAGRRRGPAGSA